MLANLLFVLLAIPLVTIPVACAGLFATMSRWVRGQPTEVFHDFFAGMRRHWRRAMLVGVVDLLIGALVVLNFWIFRLMNPSQIIVLLSHSATLFFAATAITATLYLFPLLVMFEEVPARRLARTSVKLVFAFPLWSALLLVLATLPVLITLFVLPAAFLVLGTFSFIALSNCWVVWHVVRRYVAQEEPAPQEE